MSRILSVDGGGSGFRKAIVEGTGISNLKESTSIKSAQDLVDFVAEGIPDDVDGVAYAVAGDIEDHKIVVISPNLHFLDGINLAHITTVKTQRATVVCNDMEAAVSGMAVMFPELDYFMGITWSSGIGLRIIKDGKIISASEGGHAQLDPSPYAPVCGCGKRGCVEAILGGVNMQKRVMAELAAKGIRLPDAMSYGEYLDSCQEKKEEWAVEVYDKLIFGMARFLANIQITLCLQAIVWKGGIAKGILSKQKKDTDVLMLMGGMMMNPYWARKLKFYYCWQASELKDADSLLGAAAVYNH